MIKRALPYILGFYIATFLLAVLAVKAFGAEAEKLPTCDQVVEAIAKDAAASGFQPGGSQGIPGGQVIFWQSQKKVLALVLIGAPLKGKGSDAFSLKGQCTGPAGTALIYMTEGNNESI